VDPPDPQRLAHTDPSLGESIGEHEPAPPQVARQQLPTPRPIDAGALILARRQAAQRLADRFDEPGLSLAERQVILHQLASLGGDPDYATFRRVLTAGRNASGLKHSALEALRLYPTAEAVPFLVLGLGVPELELATYQALTELESGPQLEALVRVIPRLTTPRARLIAAEGLATAARVVPAPVQEIVALLHEGQVGPLVAQPLIETLAASRSPEALPTLLRLAAKGADWRVRAEACRSLAGFAGDPPREALIASLHDNGTPHRVREEAALALGAFSDRETVGSLVASLDTACRGCYGAAVLSLQQTTGLAYFQRQEWEGWWERGGAAAEPVAPLGHGTQLRPVAQPPQDHIYQLPIVTNRAVFLLDVSDSMRHEGRLAAARQELVRALAALDVSSRFEVGVFATGSQYAFRGRLLTATSQNRRQATAFVQTKEMVGRTDLAGAIDQALGLPDVDTVFLFTDGNPSMTEGVWSRSPDALRLELKLRYRQLRVRIHAIGLFHGASEPVVPDEGKPEGYWPARLLRGIARDSGGVFLHN
jgi:HEAT repeat protein